MLCQDKTHSVTDVLVERVRPAQRLTGGMHALVQVGDSLHGRGGAHWQTTAVHGYLATHRASSGAAMLQSPLSS